MKESNVTHVGQKSVRKCNQNLNNTFSKEIPASQQENTFWGVLRSEFASNERDHMTCSLTIGLHQKAEWPHLKVGDRFSDSPSSMAFGVTLGCSQAYKMNSFHENLQAQHPPS